MKTNRRMTGVAAATLVVAVIVGPGIWILSDPNFGKTASGSLTAKRSVRLPQAGSHVESDPRIPVIGSDFIDDSGNGWHFVTRHRSLTVAC